MDTKKLYEFEDDAAADSAVASVTSSLTKLASAITNKKDFSRVVEAIAKWLRTKKGTTLSGLDNDPNYKLVMTYLNKMQSDLDDKNKKSVSNPVAKK
jgi:hypothetical protein